MTAVKFLNFSKHLRGQGCLHSRILLPPKQIMSLENLCHYGSSYTSEKNCLLHQSVTHCTIVTRQFHVSHGLYKKNTFKPEVIETVNVFDASGEFVWAGERLIVQKFCHRYHRFAFEDVGKFNDKQPAQYVNGAKNVQLKDKKQVSATEDVSEDKQGKGPREIQLGKNPEEEVKLNKIRELLINDGEVLITLNKKSKDISQVKSFVQKYGDFGQAIGDFKVIAKPVTPEILASIFTDIQQEEAKYIQKFKDMVKTMEQYSS